MLAWSGVLSRAMLAWAVFAFALLLGRAGDAHVLDLPYRSQLDGSSYALANCGPTALAMALAYYGVDASPWELRVRSMKAQHSWVTDEGGYSDRYGVFVYNLATVSQEMGMHIDGLWDRDGARNDRLHQWLPHELRREVLADRPVIVEVAYRALPGNGRSRAMDDHYVVVYGTVGEDFVYSDPLGKPGEVISEGELMYAMSRAEAPRAGFAVVKPAAAQGQPRGD